ncbi:hypothetical protein AMJ85_10655 [candidate division BRC1 bacterium SM23_51]|nr:MAG: hypothetical protein AMJ85_10655 [candidate division BRC1 bacterium SM23_51]
MDTETLEREFKQKVCDQVRLNAEGLNRYVIHQPFTFDDGDHFVVVLKQEQGNWVFTDEGHTLMHVQYDDIDLEHGTRASLLDSTLSAFALENRSGELRIPVPQGRFGDALYSFLQALNKIADLDFLTRERVHTMFLEDARAVIGKVVPESRRVFEYHDPQRDPDRNYLVDCRINTTVRPNFVFFINSDSHCQNATIVCHQYEKWSVHFRATGIFEDQTKINRRALAQFSDVAYKQFPSLGSEDRIRAYFADVVRGET